MTTRTPFALPSWRWRVWYADHSNRDVIATSKAGALRVAKYAARVVGIKGQGARPVSAKCLFAVGTNHPPGLFPPDETPAEFLEGR